MRKLLIIWSSIIFSLFLKLENGLCKHANRHSPLLQIVEYDSQFNKLSVYSHVLDGQIL